MIIKCYLFSLLLFTNIFCVYSQDYYSFSNTPNTWKTTPGGGNCSCTPTAGSTVSISHNWANSSFYPLTHPANLGFGNFMTTGPGAVIVESGGVVYQNGIPAAGQTVTVKSGGMWGFSGALTLGTGSNQVSSFVNNGSVLANGSFTNNITIYSTGEWCTSGSFLNSPTGSLNDITDANMASDFTDVNYGSASCYSGVPLPIELIQFKIDNGKESGKNVFWTTATEVNNDYFILEKSRDLNNFEEITRIEGAGNSLEALDYSYTDYDEGQFYYRLKQVDFDGTFTYSNVIVSEMFQNEVVVYPNPVSDILKVDLLSNTNSREEQILTKLLDLSGKTVIDEISSLELDLSQVSDGVYYIEIKTKDHIHREKIRISR